MQPDVPMVTSLTVYIREGGPECLTPCLLNVSEVYFLLFFFHKKGHFPSPSICPILGVVFSASVGVTQMWMVVPGVSVGSLLCSFSVVDKAILHLLLKLHLTTFLMEEKCWTISEASRASNKQREISFPYLDFCIKTSPLFWKKIVFRVIRSF